MLDFPAEGDFLEKGGNGLRVFQILLVTPPLGKFCENFENENEVILNCARVRAVNYSNKNCHEG